MSSTQPTAGRAHAADTSMLGAAIRANLTHGAMQLDDPLTEALAEQCATIPGELPDPMAAAFDEAEDLHTFDGMRPLLAVAAVMVGAIVASVWWPASWSFVTAAAR